MPLVRLDDIEAFARVRRIKYLIRESAWIRAHNASEALTFPSPRNRIECQIMRALLAGNLLRLPLSLKGEDIHAPAGGAFDSLLPRRLAATAQRIATPAHTSPS